jgi:hypothetical protein
MTLNNLNELSQVIDPLVHDAKLMGLILKENDSATLYIKDEAGNRHDIELRGVIRLKADDFKEGNVILYLAVLNGPEFEISMLADLFGVELEKEKLKPYFQDTADKLKSRHLSLVSLVPSYGCKLLALCSEIQVLTY